MVAQGEFKRHDRQLDDGTILYCWSPYENAMTGDGHPYAPLSGPNALYLKTTMDSVKNFCNTEQQPLKYPSGEVLSILNVKEAYVPISYLQALNGKKLAYDILRVEDQIDLKKGPTPAKTKFDNVSDAFVFGQKDPTADEQNLTCGESEPVIAKFITRLQTRFTKKTHRYDLVSPSNVLLFRNKEGDLLCWPYNMDIIDRPNIRLAWETFWKNTALRSWEMKAKVSSWRPRYEKMELSKPLVVYLLPGANERFWPDARQMFSKFITHVNTYFATTQMELASNDWKSTNYSLLSEDPFRLFQTYIHNDSIDVYMKTLGKDTDSYVYPVRKFPTENDFEEMAKIYFTLMENGTETDDVDEDEEEPVTTLGIENMATDGTVPKMVAVNDSQEISIVKSNNNLVLPDQINGQIRFDAGPWNRTLEVTLNSDKIKTAAGTRGTQKDQKRVMGFSASHFAEKVLHWEAHPIPTVRKDIGKDPLNEGMHPNPAKVRRNARQMNNGLYIAEWLHLSAYSWGGIKKNVPTDEMLRSSQHPDNLVLGTSEANSCMTRYERAWQQFFRDEDLFNKDPTKKLKGTLWVKCNKASRVRYADQTRDKKFFWDKVPTINDSDLLARFAKTYSFLAYDIEYQIVVEGPSCILNKTTGPTLALTTTFYPFSRRFYHYSENLLDTAVYYEMFRLAAHKKFPVEKDREDLMRARWNRRPDVHKGTMTQEEIDAKKAAEKLEKKVEERLTPANPKMPYAYPKPMTGPTGPAKKPGAPMVVEL